MKRLAFAGLSAAAVFGIAAPALAADLPQPAEPAPTYYDDQVPEARFDWGGAYVGANLGWGFGSFSNGSAPDTDGDGIQGGVHAGYNYVISPNVVIGAEADFQFSDLDDSASAGGSTIKTSSDWNSSIRGRLGYTFDRFMVYGTGGLAIADLDVGVDGDNKSMTTVGWTGGAGVEGAITNNVTARLEYVYQDYAGESFTLNNSRYKTDLDDSVVRFGLSYKF